MYCSKCGKFNLEEAKFCQHCGSEMNNTEKKEETPNEAGIRKSIKTNARHKKKNIMSLAVLIMYIVIALIIYGIYEILGYYIFDIYVPFKIELIALSLFIIFGLFFTFSLTGLAYKSNKNEKLKFSEIFSIPFKNFTKLIYSYILHILFIVLTIVTIYFSDKYITNDTLVSVIIIALLVISFYIYPILDIFNHYVLDTKNKDKNFITSIKETFKLIKGHRGEYYAMYFSFSGWFLLGIFTFGILYLWLLPYIFISINGMYLNLQKEITINSNEKGLSNAAILGVTAGIFIAFIITLGVIATIIEDNDLKDEPIYDPETSYNEVVLSDEDESITFSIPSTFYTVGEPTTDYHELENYWGDYITYTVNYKYNNYYNQVKDNATEYFNNTYEYYTVNEYKTSIDNIDIEAFYIDYLYDDFLYRETYAFMPLSENYYICIILGIEELTADNLADYIIIGDNYHTNL